jgi:alpha-L-arabinofuranosidase
MRRRAFLAQGAASIVGTAAGSVLRPAHATTPPSAPGEVLLEPHPLFDLSPYLYMQFMEPLGEKDGSVAASWDYDANRWRSDVVSVTKELAPTMMRWGGCFSSYYRWKEAIGPRTQRVPMENLLWGGMNDNQVGTVEFVDFCRQVGAEPLMCVNFDSDGRKRWMRSPSGSTRSAGPDEAAEWVDYCNNAQSALRRSHGIPEPRRIGFWQLGNETSYDRRGFDLETAANKTVQFARAMRRVDPTIKLIGWGDTGWARRMIEVAGEHLQFIAFHHMYDPGAGNKDSVLHDYEYRKDPATTWAQLMEAWRSHEAKIKVMRQQVEGTGIPLALTECHFSLRGPNRCEVLSSWAAGVAMARLLNVHTRHGDVLKIATAADFCGTSWQVNAILIPTSKGRGRAFMQPVARVMSLYRHHVGSRAVRVAKCPEGLDVTASRDGNRFFLHVINTSRDRAVDAQFRVEGLKGKGGKVFEIAADPSFEIRETSPDAFSPVEKVLPEDGCWRIPPAAVSAVEFMTG